MSGRGEQTTFREEIREGLVLEQARADRAARRISDVALLGRVSKNNRVCSKQALRDAVELYPGAQVYLDHPTESEMRDRDGVRSVRDLAGRVANPRLAGDMVRGDLEVLESDTGSLVLSLAEQMPEVVGMSHRASGTVRVNDEGTQIVEGLDRVFGVELVTEPASTGGLTEALDRRRRREEAVREVLQENDLDPDRFGIFIRWASARPDGAAQARQLAAEFDRCADPRQYRGRGGGGPAAVAPERDPDEELCESARRDGGRTPVTSDTVADAHGRLFH